MNNILFILLADGLEIIVLYSADRMDMLFPIIFNNVWIFSNLFNLNLPLLLFNDYL
jgi:hypothetical protein